MEVHRGAKTTLQQRVMEFLRDPRPLRKALVEAYVELLGQLMQTKTVSGKDGYSASKHSRQAEPPCLPECRQDLKRDHRLSAVKDPFTVARRMRKYSIAGRTRSLPSPHQLALLCMALYGLPESIWEWLQFKYRGKKPTTGMVGFTLGGLTGAYALG